MLYSIAFFKANVDNSCYANRFSSERELDVKMKFEESKQFFLTLLGSCLVELVTADTCPDFRMWVPLSTSFVHDLI